MPKYLNKLWLKYWAADVSISIRRFWHKYAGSAAVVGLLAAIAVALHVDRRKTEQVAEVVRSFTTLQATVDMEREERLKKVIADSLQKQRQDAERIMRRQKEINLFVAEIVRHANIEGCKRENVTRRRLREAAFEQLNVTKNITRRNTKPDQPLSEWIRDWADYDEVWRRLIRDLQQTNCEKVYPPVAIIRSGVAYEE